MRTRSDNPGRYLGSYLGRKDPAHIAVFVRAGCAARANPELRCVATTRNPPFQRCQCPAMRGSKSQRCQFHTPFLERVQLDAERRGRLLDIVQNSRWENERQDALRGLAAIDRRAARFRQIYIDPRAGEIEIKFAAPAHEALCVDWLKSKGYPLDAVSAASGELPSTRCQSRCLVAAARHLIKQNLSEAKALASVRKAHADDARFFRKLREAERRAD